MKPLLRAGALTTAVAVVAGLAACAPQQSSDDAGTTRLSMNAAVWALSGDWNPATTTYLNTISQPIQAVYESLIQLNPTTFEWEPLLAESYEIADDQRSITLELRQDVEFTDGTPFDAEAAKASLEDNFAGTFAWFDEQYVIDLEVTGDHELVVSSEKAITFDFLLWFGIIPIVSPTAVDTDPEGLSKMPVGTGPYVLTGQVAEVSVSFERNPDYRDPEAYPFDEIDFTIFDDSIAVSNALKSGQLNAATDVDPAYAADLEANGFVLSVGVGSQMVLTWSDRAGTAVPALADVRVRRAIAYAIDRAAIIENIEYGYGTVLSQVWGPGSRYYVEGGDDAYAYDLEKARDLMAEAGYEDGFAVTIPNYPLQTKYEPVITQALADIGITVTFEQFSDGAGWSEANASGKYGLALGNTSDLWNTVRGFSPEIDALYETIDTGTRDDAEEAFRAIGEIVLDDVYQIALSRPAQIWATVPEITVEASIVSGWPTVLGGVQLAG